VSRLCKELDGQVEVFLNRRLEGFWTDFLRSLVKRGLSGVRLVISDAHEGLKKAVAKTVSAT
jgi:transposase-like protein